jgi:hypothetical protein
VLGFFDDELSRGELCTCFMYYKMLKSEIPKKTKSMEELKNALKNSNLIYFLRLFNYKLGILSELFNNNKISKNAILLPIWLRVGMCCLEVSTVATTAQLTFSSPSTRCHVRSAKMLRGHCQVAYSTAPNEDTLNLDRNYHKINTEQSTLQSKNR